MNVARILVNNFKNRLGRIKSVFIGKHFVLTQSSNWGLSSHLKGNCKKSGNICKILHDVKEDDLYSYALSDDTLKVSLFLSWLNANLNIDKKGYEDINAFNIIKEKGKGKNVVIIGHFPLPENFARDFKDFHIIEKKPIKGDILFEDSQSFIEEADVLGITATTILNHTLGKILSWKKHSSFTILMGFSTPLWEGLFDMGIDVLCGSLVVNSEDVLDALKKGLPYKKTKGIRKVALFKK